jgi:hypothetical protein
MRFRRAPRRLAHQALIDQAQGDDRASWVSVAVRDTIE